MNYVTNDVQFPLPSSDYEDQSIQIIRLANEAGTLVVSRSTLDEALSLKDNFAQQMAQLQANMQGFILAPAREISIGAAQDIDAIESQCRFEQGQTPVHQLQIMCRIPQSVQALAISFARQQPMDANAFTYWESLKAQLCFKA